MYGEICNGIGYFESSKAESFTGCIGKRVAIKNFPDIPSPPPTVVSSKYIRSIGSTGLFSNGKTSSAHSLGPVDAYAVEVGPLEEAIVELGLRIGENGWKPTLVRPMELLLKRTELVAEKSVSLLSNALFPLPEFIYKLKSRIPQLVKESYNIASSFRIEIEIKKNEPE